jgi:hypothetical protein
MAKVALNLKGLDDRQKLAKFKKGYKAVEAHPTTFPTPTPSISSCETAHDDAEDVLDELEAAEQKVTELREKRDQKMAIAMQKYEQLGSEVETKSGGDPMKIAEGGYDVALPPSGPQPMPKPENNTVTAGDNDGDATAACDGVKGVKSYQWETASNPAGPWVFEAVTTVSEHKMHGKPSGQKLWTRVAAVNKLGPGPWSDPACCTVP